MKKPKAEPIPMRSSWERKVRILAKMSTPREQKEGEEGGKKCAQATLKEGRKHGCGW